MPEPPATELTHVTSGAGVVSPTQRELAVPSASPPARLSGVVGRLTAANSLLLLAGLVTGPLQARALGPAGRGEIAAVVSVLSLAPTVASLGLGSYAIWAVARGRRPGEILGTIIPLYGILGVLFAALAFPLSAALSGGHEAVQKFLLIGLLLLPVTLIGTLCLDVAIGLEMWGTVVASRVANAAMVLLPVWALFALGALNVSSAAIVAIASGGGVLLSIVSLARRRLGRLRWRHQIAREGLTFGLKAWLGGVSSVTNARFDQVIMLDFTTARQLGLYAVAVSVSGIFLFVVINSIQYAIAPQLSRGDNALVSRSTRATVIVSLLLAAGTAIISPFALRYGFGHAFLAAEPMLLILLAASLPLAMNAVLSTICSSAGYPGIAARAELLALFITVPALVLLVGPLGGIGAALTSALAYSVTDAYLLRETRRRFGGRLSDYLVPRVNDLAMVATLAQRLLSIISAKRPPRP